MLVFVSEQVNLRERMKSVMWQWHEDIKDYFSDGTLCKGLDTFSLDYQDYLDNVQHRNTILLDNFTRGTSDLTLRELFNMSVKRLSIWSGSVSILCDDLDAMLAQGYTVVVLCGTEKAAKNLCDDLKTHDKMPFLLQMILLSEKISSMLRLAVFRLALNILRLNLL